MLALVEVDETEVNFSIVYSHLNKAVFRENVSLGDSSAACKGVGVGSDEKDGKHEVTANAYAGTYVGLSKARLVIGDLWIW